MIYRKRTQVYNSLPRSILGNNNSIGTDRSHTAMKIQNWTCDKYLIRCPENEEFVTHWPSETPGEYKHIRYLYTYCLMIIEL